MSYTFLGARYASRAGLLPEYLHGYDDKTRSDRSDNGVLPESVGLFGLGLFVAVAPGGIAGQDYVNFFPRHLGAINHSAANYNPDP